MSSISSTAEVEAPDDIEAQTKIMMDKLCRTLETAGADIKKTLKLNVFLVRPLDESLSTPLTFSYYLLNPKDRTGQPKVEAFRDWLLEETHN
ncbi:MAG: enamine deaminase RidA (YjgF/YER057c/UK114 family) [Gammaproteobacteria bacterium]|jgi:enamine deaminase RidA (YjgF/YER057c/UK114 family)